MTDYKNTNLFIPFLVGGVIGGVYALLMAPSSGKETRSSINKLTGRIFNTANEQRKILINDAQTLAKNFVRKADTIFNKSKNYAEGKYNSSAYSIELEIRSLRNAINASVDAYKKNNLNEVIDEIPIGVINLYTEDETLPKYEGMGRRNK